MWLLLLGLLGLLLVGVAHCRVSAAVLLQGLLEKAVGVGQCLSDT